MSFLPTPEAGSLGEPQRRAADFRRRRLNFASNRQVLSAQEIGTALGEWQDRELRIVRGFGECRGLNKQQLEDIYQETVLALYQRTYVNEEHLRNALRRGIKQRALRLHRDERRRGRRLARTAPALHAISEADADQAAPEPIVLAHEDRLIAKEFLTELTDLERRVFGWLVEGLRYRAIASALGIPENQARNAVRACDRKRERFQLLYDTGRLCGYRAQTIQALQNGQRTTEDLAERAFAHLESCAHCRREHKTNAQRLRHRFGEQAAALLPPLLTGHLGRVIRLSLRARFQARRLWITLSSAGSDGLRERALAVVSGSGTSSKLAAGILTVGALAGGTVASRALKHGASHVDRNLAATSVMATLPIASAWPTVTVPPFESPKTTDTRRGIKTSRHLRARRAGAHRGPSDTQLLSRVSEQRKPDSQSYLSASTSTTSAPLESAHTSNSPEEQRGGGPFGP